MTYKSAYFCCSCKHELTWDEMMHSYGTCPYCGACSDNTGVNNIKVSYKLVAKKRHVTFLKIFSTTFTTHIRVFKHDDVETHQLKLSTTDIIQQENDL